MALAQVNVGTVANDGTGDTIRASFQKVNANNLLFSTVALSGAYTDLTGKPSLATVATSGAYADLSGAPTVLKAYVASSDPGAANDNTQGYAAGSVGLNSSTGAAFRCLSAGTGVAVWLRQAYADHPGYVVNGWYLPWPAVLAGSSALAINSIRLIPFIPVSDVTINSLGARCTTVGTTNTQFAIYASTAPGTLQRPTGSQLSSTASIVNTSTGVHSAALGASVALSAGLVYWLAVNCGDSAAVYAVPTSGIAQLAWMIGSATSTTTLSTSSLTSLSTPVTFGTWGDLTSATFTEATDTKYCFVGFKVASVP